MEQSCPYCSGDLIPGAICAAESAGLSFNARPHSESFLICGPYFIRRDVSLDSFVCKKCHVILTPYQPET